METNGSFFAIEPAPELREAIENLWQMLRSIEPSLNRMANHNDRLIAENAGLLESIEQSEKKLAESHGIIEALKGQTEEDSSKMTLLINQYDDLKQENLRIAELEQKLADVAVHLKEAEDIKANFAMAQKEFASRNQVLQERAETIKSLNARIAELEEKVGENQSLRETIKGKDSELLELSKHFEILLTENKELNVSANSLLEVTKEIESLKTALAQKETALQEMSVRLTAIDSEKQALQTNYLETEQLFEEEIAELNQLIDDYKDQTGKRDETLQTMTFEMESLRLNKTELEDQRLAGEAVAEEMRGKLKQKADEIAIQKSSNDALKEQIQKLQNDIQSYIDSAESNSRDETENYRVELSKKNAEIVNLQAERDDYIMKSLELESQINQLTNNLEAKNTEIEKIGQMLSSEGKIQDELTSVRDEFAIVSEKIKELESKKSELQTNLEIAQTALLAKEKELSHYKQLTEEFEDRISSQSAPTLKPEDIAMRQELITRIEGYIEKIDQMLVN